MAEILRSYAKLDKHGAHGSIFSSFLRRLRDFEESGFLEILYIDKYGNIQCGQFCILTMDNNCRFFGGGFIDGEAHVWFPSERIYRFIFEKIEYDRFAPVRSFIGSIMRNNAIVYLTSFQSYPGITFSLSFDFVDAENINRYHGFDSLGYSVMMDLTQLELSDLQIIAVDASNVCNPFTRADDGRSGDLMMMISHTSIKNLHAKEYVVFPLNIQRLKTSCLCKGSEAGWNNFLARFSKEYRTAYFDTLQSDSTRRLWRTNKNFKMYIESFQEVL